MNEENQLLRDTQDYLRDHRNASKTEILDAIEDLDVALLDRWVKEGRIHLFDPEEESKKDFCIYCGREVSDGGKICKTCQIKKALIQHASKTAEKPPPSEVKPKKRASGMHFKKW